MPVDYKIWDHIEVSDDEDDTNPHIETASLFRLRHQARLEKMAESKLQKREIKIKLENCLAKIDEIKTKLQSSGVSSDEVNQMEIDLNRLEKEYAEAKQKETELMKKMRPWNVDTIAHDSFSKTRINKPEESVSTDRFSDEENELYFKKFMDSNKELIKRFGMLSKYEESQQFLLENRHLCCEETANVLVLICLDYEMEGKHNLMKHVARQTVLFQYMLDLAKEICVNSHSTNLISSFFTKFTQADKSYLDAFEEDLSNYVSRIRDRAKVKVQDREEKERQKRLGPGGLDPVEVFASLPLEMQECFKSRNINQLKELALQMNLEEFEHHLQRCIDSGLWVPEASKDSKENESASGDKVFIDHDHE